MIRLILIFILFALIYYSLRTLFRSAVGSYRRDEGRPAIPKGEEMVLDPVCGTYIIKDRALTERFNGRQVHFCSDACAQKFREQGGK